MSFVRQIREMKTLQAAIDQFPAERGTILKTPVSRLPGLIATIRADKEANATRKANAKHPADTIKIKTGKPGSNERIEALREFYARGGGGSPFDVNEVQLLVDAMSHCYGSNRPLFAQVTPERCERE